jgi:MoaA/NifB/PqqE/SkfB family radical SAM enzyme
MKDSQLNVYNFQQMRAQPPSEFEVLRIDTNNDCNVHCVYCHNHRSKETISTDDLRAFVYENVVAVDTFQFGCVMEPTLDPRMADLMLMVASSPARPRQTLMLQTNGILLHRHEHSKLRDAGLTQLFVSIDAANPVTHKLLRGGTSMAKVHSNLRRFRENCRSVEIVFITTVTTLNIDAMEELVTFGVGLGVAKFVLREVFYYPDSNVVDHSRMPALILDEGAFGKMKGDLLRAFGDRVEFHFADAPLLERRSIKMRADSFR